MRGRVLIVAGSDSGGGAGLQGDVKTVTALGGYAMTAVTALTAQDSTGVHAVLDVPADFVARQMTLALRDFGADCVKIGMLHRSAIVNVVADVLVDEAPGTPIVLDPVMIAKGGCPLIDCDAIDALRLRLLPVAAIVTPNLPEAARLADSPAHASPASLAMRLLAAGPRAALVKGGHGEGPNLTDVLLERGRRPVRFQDARIDTRHTHGTGCALASAIATGLAQGFTIEAAVIRARAYVRRAIRLAPGLGSGHGPLNHAHTVRPSP